jgi:hypothetical protein
MAHLTDTVMQVASTQVVAFTGTSAQSTAISGGSGPFELVMLVGTQDCHFVEGDDPTATTSNQLLPANCPMVFKIDTGNKLAVIQNSASGNLYISRMV